MFENTGEDINPPFSDKKFPQFPTPPNLQRSMSAPAIAEHVSEAILPFNLEKEDNVGLNVSSYSYGSNPNRLNPRMPTSKRPDQHEENEFKTLLDESTAEWSSMLGNSGRNPMDIIQGDFPSASTGFYGNNPSAESSRLSPMVSSAGPMPALISNAVMAKEGLDTKTVGKLYVSSDLSPKGSASSAAPTPMLSQYHTPLNTSATTFFHAPKSPVPAGGSSTNLAGSGASINSIIGSEGDAFGSSTVPIAPQLVDHSQMGISAGSAGFLSGDATVFNYSGQGVSSAVSTSGFSGMLGSKPTSVNSAYQVMPPQVNAVNPVYQPMQASQQQQQQQQPQLGNQQMPQLMMQQTMPIPQTMQAGPQQNNGYFVQPQQMFVNNGQPMYFRSGPNVQQFSQDGYNMYPGNVMDSSMQMQATPMISDPSQLAQQQQLQQQQQQFVQYGNMQQTMNNMQQPQQYWSGVTPEQGMNPQAPIYVSNQQSQQQSGGMRMSNLQEEPMRIMFNSNVSFGNMAGNVNGALGMQQTQQAPQQQNVVNSMGGRPMNQMNQAMSQQYAMNNGGNQMMSGGMNMMNPIGGGMMQGGAMQNNRGDGNGMMQMNQQYGNNNGGGLRGDEDGHSMHRGHHQGGYDDGSSHHNNGYGGGNRGDRRDYNDRNNNGYNNNNNHYRDRNNNNYMDNGRGNNGRDRGDRNMHNRNNYNNGGNNNNSNSPHYSGGGGNGGNGHMPRDALVDEFRSSFGKPGRTWSLKELQSHIVAFCQDQHGSRFIQQRLEVCTEAEKQLVFDEVLPSAHLLMTDVFGNYVLQKLFEYGVEEQCEALAAILKGQAVTLSMQMYGCRVVQKALEYVSRDRLVELVAEFEVPQALIDCVHDSNGNHVIQKCIEIVSKASRQAESKETSEYLSGRIQFIISQFQGRVKELSSHPYGCRVVQRILEHCNGAQKDVVLEELRECCGDLVQDCYGNYVIQFVMQHGCEADQNILIKNVMDNLLEYSQHKFASNVVEKCLQFASRKDRDDMIWKIINATFDLSNPVDKQGHCVLETMVRDPYANYVVQKVIEVSDERQRGAIMRYVKDNIAQLRKYTYGKHIIICLEKITNEKF